MKPAVGGMPPSDSMNSSIANAANGLRNASPLKSFSSSPATSPRPRINNNGEAPQHDHHREGAELHERVNHQVDQRRRDAARGAGNDPDQHVAGVGDRR